MYERIQFPLDCLLSVSEACVHSIFNIIMKYFVLDVVRCFASHLSYTGCYVLHSYLTCSLESESYEPICFKVFGEKSKEHLSYKDIFKKHVNKHTDAKNFILT